MGRLTAEHLLTRIYVDVSWYVAPAQAIAGPKYWLPHGD